MSYRCAICTYPSPPKTPRKVWPVKRENGQVAQELPVCERCHRHLVAGVPLEKLIAAHSTPLPAAVLVDPLELDGNEPTPL